MDAHKRMVVNDILAKNGWKFIVPIYQRAYKWEISDSLRLAKDILNSGKTKKEHFIGSIVYQNEKDVNMSEPKLYLVDGQQRLTTLVLITKALNLIAQEMLAEGENDDAKYVFSKTNNILFIDVDDKQKGYKIEPSKKDADTFNGVIKGENIKAITDSPIIDKTSSIYLNFREIYDYLKNEIESGTNIKEEIYNSGLLYITVVEIVLNADEDAQEIFESINSLGVDLTNSDLIRNYLLMTNSKQKELYQDCWEPIEKMFPNRSLESFIKDYLLMRLEYSFNDRDTYKEYQKLAENSFMKDGVIDKEAMLKDLYNVAKVYEPFVRSSTNYPVMTNALMQELRDMDQSTAYPFLMRVFLDYQGTADIKIDEETLNKTVNLIITYLVRRTICGVPTNTLRSFMLTLYKRVFKVKDNYNRYYESVYAFLLRISTYDYLRSEEEMCEKLVTAPIYKNVRFATYLLYRIENGRYKKIFSEQIRTNSTTVEHIMPQHLTDEWEKMLSVGENDPEEIHKTYIDTIGNLSLSSREKNSVMSDESFERKLEVLKGEGSKFKVLNDDVVVLTQFTESEILQREKRLESLVCERYQLPEADIEGIKFENTIEVICTEEPDQIFIGAEPLSFKMLGKETVVNSYAKIVVEVSKILLKNYPEKMIALAMDGYNPWNDSPDARKCLYIAKEPEAKDVAIGDDFYVCTTMSANYCIQFCVMLMSACGLTEDSLLVYLKADSVRKQNTIKKADKIAMVRKALKELADEGCVYYDRETMPPSDNYIKFQTETLNQLFPPGDIQTDWDDRKYNAIYYLEYQIMRHSIILTFKKIPETMEYVEVFRGLAEEDLVSKKEQMFWHTKKEKIDFEKVAGSQDPIAVLKEQIMEATNRLNEFSNIIKERMN